MTSKRQHFFVSDIIHSYQPVFHQVASFDTYHVHSSNTVLIVAGSSKGNLAMVEWGWFDIYRIIIQYVIIRSYYK